MAPISRLMALVWGNKEVMQKDSKARHGHGAWQVDASGIAQAGSFCNTPLDALGTCEDPVGNKLGGMPCLHFRVSSSRFWMGRRLQAVLTKDEKQLKVESKIETNKRQKDTTPTSPLPKSASASTPREPLIWPNPPVDDRSDGPQPLHH